MPYSTGFRIAVATLSASLAMAITWSAMRKAKRMPASSVVVDRQHLSKPLPKGPTVSANKPGGQLSLAIELVSQNEKSVVLRGHLRAGKKLNGYHYSWIVATSDQIAGIGNVAGSANTTGTVPDLEPGQSVDLSIQASSRSGGPPIAPVVLHVFRIENGEPHGVLAQWDPGGSKPKQQVPADKPELVPDGLVQ